MTQEPEKKERKGLSYRARRRWSLVILVLALPAYIFAVVTVVTLLDRPPIWVEFIVYAVLGVLWTFPLRFVFKGIGKPDPDA
ncbi:DUF2842 domain-containing protein [Chachezhania antarctica]|uniref:DUF2842 domain-containing protein n=1 Tax=Chachezhania antarctica TaxID=2340860 RepID=UPI000EAE9FCE|nr:DUF2842 domain-containing protein [Chachezhania antarctica]|tara:strand:- start:350 stop:595 length:246 start_codon:yes stop_codon:yes gene_type:complete